MIKFESIPYFNHGKSIHNLLPKNDWNAIRQKTFFDANNQCKCCGSQEKLECNELWEFDDVKKIQKLVGFECLCKKCHLATHILLAGTLANNKEIDFQNIVDHYMKVNEVDYDEFLKRHKENFNIFQERNHFRWEIEYADIFPEKVVFEIKFKEKLKDLKSRSILSVSEALLFFASNKQVMSSVENIESVAKVLDNILCDQHTIQVILRYIDDQGKSKILLSFILKLLEYRFKTNMEVSSFEIYGFISDGGCFKETGVRKNEKIENAVKKVLQKSGNKLKDFLFVCDNLFFLNINKEKIEEFAEMVIRTSKNKMEDFLAILDSFNTDKIMLVKLGNNEKILKQIKRKEITDSYDKLFSIPIYKTHQKLFRKTKLFSVLNDSN